MFILQQNTPLSSSGVEWSVGSSSDAAALNAGLKLYPYSRLGPRNRCESFNLKGVRYIVLRREGWDADNATLPGLLEATQTAERRGATPHPSGARCVRWRPEFY